MNTLQPAPFPRNHDAEAEEFERRMERKLSILRIIYGATTFIAVMAFGAAVLLNGTGRYISIVICLFATGALFVLFRDLIKSVRAQR